MEKIIELSDHHIVGVKNVSMNEWFFPGHFPGAPLVPGVYVLAAIAEVARRAGVARGDICSVERAKWTAPAYPDQALRITLTVRAVDGGWRVDGEVSGPSAVCATARLLLA